MLNQSTRADLKRTYARRMGMAQALEREIEALQDEVALRRRSLEFVLAEMTAIETTIKLAEPNWANRQAVPIRPTVRKAFGEQGAYAKHARDVLRGSESPMTVREIASEVMRRMGFDHKTDFYRVSTAIRALVHKNDPVSFVRVEGSPIRYALVTRRA